MSIIDKFMENKNHKGSAGGDAINKANLNVMIVWANELEESLRFLDGVERLLEAPKIEYNSAHHCQLTLPFARFGFTALVVICSRESGAPMCAWLTNE